MPDRLRISGDADLTVSVAGATIAVDGAESWTIAPGDDGRVRVASETHAYIAAVADAGTTVWVSIAGDVFAFEIAETRPRSASADRDALASPMPATVVRIAAAAGQAVRQGDVLITLEAMKMQWPLRAPRDGTIGRILCREGDIVAPGAPLAELEPPAVSAAPA